MEDLFGYEQQNHATNTIDFGADLTTSTLRSASQTHRVCAKTRDAVVEAEKRLSELKGEMKSIERSFTERNAELNVELKDARRKGNEYRIETEKLKSQIIRLVELDEVKNKDIQTLESKVDHFHKKLESFFTKNTQEVFKPEQAQQQEKTVNSQASNSTLVLKNERTTATQPDIHNHATDPEQLKQSKEQVLTTVERQKSNFEKQEHLQRHSHTLQLLQQECLNLLFAVRSSEGTEAKKNIWKSGDETALTNNSANEKSQLSNEIGGLEHSIQRWIHAIQHFELSDGPTDLSDIELQTSASFSFFQSVLRVLSCVGDMLQSRDTAATKPTLLPLMMDAACQTDEDYFHKVVTDDGKLHSPQKMDTHNIEMMDSWLLEMKASVDSELDRAKKALYRLKQRNARKAEELSHRVQEVFATVNSPKQKADNSDVLITLYQQLTNLYNQNLELAKQFQVQGNQNVTDLKVRLEKGVKDQANFTNYIASITRREDSNEEPLRLAEDQTAEKYLQQNDTEETHQRQQSSAKVLSGNDTRNMEQMTEKYQKLWNKYRRQSARFRAVQELLDATHVKQKAVESEKEKEHNGADLNRIIQAKFSKKSGIKLKGIDQKCNSHTTKSALKDIASQPRSATETRLCSSPRKSQQTMPLHKVEEAVPKTEAQEARRVMKQCITECCETSGGSTGLWSEESLIEESSSILPSYTHSPDLSEWRLQYNPL